MLHFEYELCMQIWQLFWDGGSINHISIGNPFSSYCFNREWCHFTFEILWKQITKENIGLITKSNTTMMNFLDLRQFCWQFLWVNWQMSVPVRRDSTNWNGHQMFGTSISLSLFSSWWINIAEAGCIFVCGKSL